MDQLLTAAFRHGYERMAAWSDLLDNINLYPVADADTGRNLRISLAPLKAVDHKNTGRHLLLSAAGNSGNIAGAYFARFIQLQSHNSLFNAAAAGKDAAWNALVEPRNGTMLSIFDTLLASLNPDQASVSSQHTEYILKNLHQAVLATATELPQLRAADVVDSGALGIFLFFEGFFKSLSGMMDVFDNPYRTFGSKLIINKYNSEIEDNSYCVDTVIIPRSEIKAATERVAGFGNHVVAVEDGRYLKIHLHASDTANTRENLAAVGEVVQWRAEKIENRDFHSSNAIEDDDRVHTVTDAAGSLAPEVARELGITVLDSYIIMDDVHLPESLVDSETLYDAMKRGVKVTTAQASVFERHQRYEWLSQRYRHLIYLCVGSVYTGNFEIASGWAAKNANDQRPIAVIDTGAASGRLGLIARCVARYADTCGNLSQTARYALDVSRQYDELVFLDQLKYLAAGGRLSRTSGFFGDMLSIKPVIRPGAEGAQKLGAVRNRKSQIDFALNHFGAKLDRQSPVEILLQYTDNQDWVRSRIQPEIESLLPFARMSVEPMSLTSGAHMGPGTWAVAYGPVDPEGAL